jgi:hypothetical protein
MRDSMNNKMFFFLFSIFITSMQANWRVSRFFTTAFDSFGKIGNEFRASVHQKIVVKKDMVNFVKTDEFQQLLKTVSEAKKEEIKQKYDCLKGHFKIADTRKVMIGSVIMDIGQSLEQTMQTRPHVTFPDITIAVFQAVHNYAAKNIVNDTK